jgi:Flp pilus assembly protein TadD
MIQRFATHIVCLICALVAIATWTGCGSKSMPANTIQEREKAFEDAQTKLAAKDYAGAKEAAGIALRGGGLSADQASEASMILIESSIQSGDLATAETELKNAESFAMDMVKLHILQGMLASKQGNSAAAQEAFAKARALDPNAPIPN